MADIPNLRSNYKKGQALKAVEADFLNALANFVNELEGDGCVVDKSSNGKRCRIIVNFHDDSFSVTGENKVIKTRGMTGTASAGNDLVIINGLVQSEA